MRIISNPNPIPERIITCPECDCCFSYNDKFLFALDSSEVFYELGLSVTSGHGVCRNIAAHFLDVLNEIKKSDDKKCRNLLVCTRVWVTDRVIKHPPSCFKNKISRKKVLSDTIKREISRY